jgi:hypothetical protein
MTTGAVQLRKTGTPFLGQMGGERLSWIYNATVETRPSFAVMFIQNVQNSYYNHNLPSSHPDNVAMRGRWNRDVQDYEDVAARVTDLDRWHRIIMLLVHCEMFHDHNIWPLWPPNDDGHTPYPTHINPADSVVMRWRPGFEVFRRTLEESGSPVYPRLMYYEAIDGVWTYLQPALPDWLNRSAQEAEVEVDTHQINGQQWVRWMIEILGTIL